MKMKRLLWGFLMIAAVALAGCGSNGDGGRIADLQDLLLTVEGARDEALAKVMGLEDARDEALAKVMGLEDARDEALAESMRLQDARDEALAESMRLQDLLDSAPTLVQVEKLKKDLEIEQGKVADLDRDLGVEQRKVADLDRDLGVEKDKVADLDRDLGVEKDKVARLDSRNKGFETAQNARGDSTDAAETAATAVETATKNSVKLGTLAVAGDSAMAEANAESVLGAKGKVDEAVLTAEAALASAEAALDPDATSDELTKALEAVIEVAKEQIKAAKMSAASVALKTALVAVTGSDPKDLMTAADRGEMVANDIDDALGSRVSHVVDKAPGETLKMAVRKEDHQGNTWEEIVGSAKVMMKRIAVGGRTEAVPATSIEGLSGDDVNKKDLGAAGKFDDGRQYANSTYSGIKGTAFCAGSDCKVNADGKLAGRWYFTPTSPEKWYVKDADDKDYVPETLYAQFGHWLTAKDDKITVNTYAMTSGSGSKSAFNLIKVNKTGDTLTDTSATYTGEAAGMSVEKATDADGNVTSIASGAFTASVVLNATFSASPTLGGTVSGFDGSAADSNWSVELLSRGFSGSFNDGKTVSTGQDGTWQAQAYGAGKDERPTGIFGGFNANFSDGAAAGAYATRK